jgi:Activator of Hsp90 ATPase homolog 1-like protein
MSRKDFTVSINVAQSPEQVFAAVNNVRGWWSANIDGPTDHLGAEFSFHHMDMHHSTHCITEFVTRKKVVWFTPTARINFVKDKAEWNRTTIVFDIERKGDSTELRFTHVGLVPAIECYGGCSEAWTFYITESLKALIEKGIGKPELRDQTAVA